VKKSIGLATALNPYIGYENATKVAREALRTGRTVTELVLQMGLMDEKHLREVLRPEVLTAPRASQQK
jgi:aspartate ammonia-lyase